jgi:hypothetical protein
MRQLVKIKFPVILWTISPNLGSYDRLEVFMENLIFSTHSSIFQTNAANEPLLAASFGSPLFIWSLIRLFFVVS